MDIVRLRDFWNVQYIAGRLKDFPQVQYQLVYQRAEDEVIPFDLQPDTAEYLSIIMSEKQNLRLILYIMADKAKHKLIQDFILSVYADAKVEAL